MRLGEDWRTRSTPRTGSERAGKLTFQSVDSRDVQSQLVPDGVGEVETPDLGSAKDFEDAGVE
jgi:hypothetical protein